MAGRIRIGCSGWNYDALARRRLLPAGPAARRWLEHYAERFDTVEVNSTFYRLPAPRRGGPLGRADAAGFLFAVKVSRYLTHVKRLRDAARRHLACSSSGSSRSSRAGKLGPLAVAAAADLPPRRRAAGRRARAASAAARHAFEFRHESWFADDVLALLREHGVALVIADRPKCARSRRTS